MWYPRRREDPVKRLLAGRFNAFVTLPDGLHAYVAVTKLVVVIRVFAGAYDGDPLRVHHLRRRDVPEELHDGQGWNLAALAKLLRSLGENCAADGETKVQKTKDKGTLALYARMSAQTRRKQRAGSSCLMIPCAAIRAHIPALKAETVKFWLLAASHGDELGRAFAGVDHFWSMGYHPEKTVKQLRELEQLGLMRYTRLNERDPKTGWYLPNAYQFNPTLFYVRKARRSAALAVSDKPYGALPTWERLIGRPDRTFPSVSDHNQLVKPTPESSTKNQSQLTNASNHHHHQNSALKSGGTDGRDGRDLKQDADATPAFAPAPDGAKPKEKPARSADQTPAPHGATHDPSPGSARPPSRRADYEQPLPDEGAERLAQYLNAQGITRLWQARELVARHGVESVDRAYDMVREERRKRVVRSEYGLMEHWLSKGMVKTQDQAHYDPNGFTGFADAALAGD